MAEVRNVVVVNDHGFVNGGQAKVAIDSAKGLAARGLNVSFFAACGPMDESLEAAGVSTVCLDQKDILTEPNRPKAMARGIWNARASRELRVHLEQIDPANSIVHCHGFAKALSPSIGPVIADGPLPHVYTMHEYFLACPNGGFYDYQRNEICDRKPLGSACLATNCDVRNSAHKAWRIARQAILWKFGQMPSGLRNVICMSESQKNIMLPYIAPHTRLFHVPNPVPTPSRERIDSSLNDSFLFVGRLSPEKGASLFAKAARLAGVPAIFVGEGQQHDEIKQIYPEAVVTGWQTPEQVQEWLSQSRCLVLPSLSYETFGLVACEALNLGVPVICGKWNAAAEVIEDGSNGVLLADAQVETLAAKLAAVVENRYAFDGLRTQSTRWGLTEIEHCEELMSVYDTAAFAMP